MISLDNYLNQTKIRIANRFTFPPLRYKIKRAIKIPEPKNILLDAPSGLYVVVLFVDLKNYTPKVELEGEFSAMKVLRIFLREMIQVTKRHDGEVGDISGDRVMSLFPVSFPVKSITNTEVRRRLMLRSIEEIQNAITCAFEMQTIVQKAINPILIQKGENPISCGIGLDFGPILIVKLGMRSENEITYIGSPVNIASKLEDLAKEGEILMTKEVFSFKPPYMNNWEFFERASPVNGEKIFGSNLIYRVNEPKFVLSNKKPVGTFRPLTLPPNKMPIGTLRRFTLLPVPRPGPTLLP